VRADEFDNQPSRFTSLVPAILTGAVGFCPAARMIFHYLVPLFLGGRAQASYDATFSPDSHSVDFAFAVLYSSCASRLANRMLMFPGSDFFAS
jgi:hypothetical protein